MDSAGAPTQVVGVNDRGAAETLLRDADVEMLGRMPWSSNATFLARLAHGDVQHLGIYKPVRGERELWDFPRGLDRREIAAYRLSEALGFGCVPPTIRRDGPLGIGSMQWFVDADHSEHYFTIFEQRPALHDQLRRIAVLDVVANNTDRKSGHCLVAGSTVWAIDNGLCFSIGPKLRTVIWEFAGTDLTERERNALAGFVAAVPDTVTDELDDDETEAMLDRARRLLARGTLPAPLGGHPYPWPLV